MYPLIYPTSLETVATWDLSPFQVFIQIIMITDCWGDHQHHQHHQQHQTSSWPYWSQICRGECDNVCQAPPTTTRTTLVTARWDHEMMIMMENMWRWMMRTMKERDAHKFHFTQHKSFLNPLDLLWVVCFMAGIAFQGEEESTKVLISRGKLNSVSVRESDSWELASFVRV